MEKNISILFMFILIGFDVQRSILYVYRHEKPIQGSVSERLGIVCKYIYVWGSAADLLLVESKE
jgi:hypothetical protein